ncbi:MAG: HEAT repeat domain-containing protein [Polyangiaceae bacterium]|nr:HEAT repeat domain-containing protein [Polyangiaceae bacterium]
MDRARLAFALCFFLGLALGETTARADTGATAPAGGGLPALEVRVDSARAVVVAGGAEVPIDLPRADVAAATDVTVESIDIGQGKHVVHVRVPARATGTAWEALLAGGHATPLFAGITGPVSGDPGERTGKAVQILPGGANRYVLLGDVREDLQICGQTTTLLDPQALYPASLSFRTATVQRLPAEQREGAVEVTAVRHGRAIDPPLARLLVARGTSVPGSRGAELTDGDPSTVWREMRPGSGQGEFVVMAAPREVRMVRLELALAPASDPKAALAVPKTLYIVTPATTFEVTIPEDAAQSPGEVVEVAFPQPIETGCATLVLGDAYTRGLAHPDVGVAEVVAYSEFDVPGATLDDVASHLSGDRGAAAAQVLERAGAGALAAVAKAYESLDPRGRALAIDVAASHDPCGEAAPLLARGVCETTGEAPRKAHEKLERCPAATETLAARVREDAASRACLAPVLARIAPEAALAPVADAMAAAGEGEREARLALRSAFTEALGVAPSGTLGGFLRDAHRPPIARLEMMRAAGDRVAEAQAESDATLDELLSGAPPFRVRYLTLGPLGMLARAGDRTAAARVVGAITHDADWPVRARAAEVAAGLSVASAALASATRDAEPRVREAALGALGASPSSDAARVAAAVLAGEGFSFVKVRAIAAIDASPPSGEADRALEGALGDPSASVRGAAVTALGHHRANASRDAIRKRLEDTDEDVDVRAAAAAALGRVCDASAADRLAQLARALTIPGVDADSQAIGVGALAGLSALHPRDLRDRLAPLLAPGAPEAVRGTAERAIATPGSCR